MCSLYLKLRSNLWVHGLDHRRSHEQRDDLRVDAGEKFLERGVLGYEQVLRDLILVVKLFVNHVLQRDSDSLQGEEPRMLWVGPLSSRLRVLGWT